MPELLFLGTLPDVRYPARMHGATRMPSLRTPQHTSPLTVRWIAPRHHTELSAGLADSCRHSALLFIDSLAPIRSPESRMAPMFGTTNPLRPVLLTIHYALLN